VDREPGCMLGEGKYKLLLLGFKPRMVQAVAGLQYCLRWPDFRRGLTTNNKKTDNVRTNVVVWRV
jgi:hypothetical protein